MQKDDTNKKYQEINAVYNILCCITIDSLASMTLMRLLQSTDFGELCYNARERFSAVVGSVKCDFVISR